ncbi:MAG TPA: DNRLRE domain-containing protein [Candidatus Anaerostipes excrementavium]|uniref:DNRLRE domain-containing protein n=1 Tax=Candidatus Anaerostipes excrementavium TaxID=2838463 RepID=A0A9D1WXD1_9FIRM|nr:DNRLRE domain-containing protein [uncultured Anaerostipes sp.]HIX68914.1 DNRLRE domain-containing protein [Candidatus Anaerostipes excrementavium]
MKKQIKRGLCSFLAFVLMFTSIQWAEIGTAIRRIYGAQETQENKKEVMEAENTKNSTTFQLAGGKKQTVFYGQDVRFEDEDGKLKDYDPSLVKVNGGKSESGKDLKEYQYTNKEGDKKHYLPKDLTTETPVLMENGDYVISFAPIYGAAEEETDAGKKGAAKDTDSNQVSAAAAKAAAEENAFANIQKLHRGAVEKEEVLNAENEEEELPVKVSYESEDQEYAFVYQSLDTGVKESITLYEAPKENKLQFRFYAKGMKAKKNVLDGGITFLDKETEEIAASLEAPNMNDASGNAYSEAVSYEIEPMEGEEDTYLLTLVLDENYLKDSDRKYPVTIDPTVTWKGSTDFWDVYVINGTYKNTNFYDSGVTVMMAGKAKQGICRTYLRFKDFTAKIKGKYVDSAALTIYEVDGSQSGQVIESRQVTANWTRPGLTWSNRPGYSTKYGTATTTGTAHKARTIDLTGHARSVASGVISSYGILLKNADETKSFGKFYSSRYSNASYRPKLVITYYDGPTVPSTVTASPQYIKKDGKTTIAWSGITSKSLKQVQYRVAAMNSDKTAETKVVKDYTSTGKNTAGGNYTLDAKTLGLSDGIYRVSIRGLDNGGICGTRKSVYLYVDSVAPKIASASIDAGDGKGTTEDDPSSNMTPTLKWNVSDAYLSKVEYQVGNGEIIKAGTSASGSIKLNASNFTESGAYEIKLIVTDRSGSQTEKTLTYYLTDQAKAAEYQPKDASVRKSYGKAVISWKKEEALPGSIYYEVHRSTKEDFQPSDETLVQSALKNPWCADTLTGSGKEYYYQVRAVKLAKSGKVQEASPTVAAGKIRQDAKSEYQQFLGSKDYRDTAEISTPVGTGTIDKASGNLMYMADDFDISVGAMGLPLTRTYNSQSDKTGMLGNGWYDTFHKHLYQVGNDIVFQDSDGTYLTFQKDGNHYVSKESKDYTLELENVKNGGFEEQSPNEGSESILARSGEASEDYRPSHNVTVSSGGETQTLKETVQKTILSSCTLTDKDQNVYRFDANGFLTAQEDANGNYILYEYDDQGRLSTVTTNKNQTLTMEYGASNLLQRIDLPDGTKIAYTYDESGNLKEAKRQSADQGQSVSYPYGYDREGWLTQIDDAKGNRYTIAYEDKKAVKLTKPNGEYQKLVYGDGTTTGTSHQADGTQIAKDSMTYETATGKMLSSTNPAGMRTTYQYGNTANPLLQTGTETTVSYQTMTGSGASRSVNFQTDVKVTTSTTYDANENVTKEVDETGQTTTTTYGTGEQENLPQKEVTKNSDGDSVSDITYTYDENGNPLTEKDTVAKTESRYAYDEEDNWEMTDEWTYEEGEEISHEEISTEEADHEVEESSTTKQGDVTEASTAKYDAMGRETENTDENTGEVTKTTYDFLGRAVKIEKELDGKTQTETKAYDANGTVTSETGSTGVTTAYAYDSLNRVTKATESADGIQTVTETSYGYEDAQIHTLTGTKTQENLFVETVKTNGKTTSKSWTDASGNTVRSQSNGIYTDHVFTDDGKEIASIVLGTNPSGDGKITLNLYDKQGQQTHTIQNPSIEGDAIGTDASSIVTETQYDANGNEVSVTDGNGNKTTYAYDDQNRLTEIGQGSVKHRIAYEMGEDGTTTTSLTDANGHVNKEMTNAAGLTERTEDLGDGEEKIATSYTYDEKGNKTKETYGNGAYQTFHYDKKNRLIKTESYEAPEPAESAGSRTLMTKYSYDLHDQVIEMVDYKISGNTETAYRYTEYTYDSRGRTTGYAQIDQSRQPTQEDIRAHQITYTYNADGNLEAVSYPTKKNGIAGLRYVYNANGQLTEIKGQTESEPKTIRTYTYDAYGKIKQIKDIRNLSSDGSQAVQKDYTYDEFDRVIKISAKDLGTGKEMESYTYTYDKNSHITKKTQINRYPEKKEVNETKAYTYDTLGRLTKTVTRDHTNEDQKKTVTYTYDPAGNRLSEDDGTEKTTYTYNGLDQIKTATVEKGQSVDSVRQYSYDRSGNETEVKDSKTGERTLKAYDARNRLKEVAVMTKDGKTGVIQQNQYNGEDQRIQKIEGDQTTNYYYQDGVVSYTTDGAGKQTSQNLIGLEGNIIGTQRYDGETASYYLYQKDLQGSTTSLIKEDGTADAVYYYTDFGETTIEGDNKAGNEVCYTGGIYDRMTGLYYLNARYYNPEDGRFLTEDTYRGETDEPDTWHLYAYCANNPVNYVDPSGHKYTRRWEQLWGTYWYDTANKKKYGKHGGIRYAKSSSNKALKKYKKAIDKENDYLSKLQKNLGKQAIKSIISFGVQRLIGFGINNLKKPSSKLKKILPKGIVSVMKKFSPSYMKKSLNNIKNAQKQYKIVKSNFSKIKRK